jgi:hypothetical protein
MTADEWTVGRHLAGVTADGLALYERFIALRGYLDLTRQVSDPRILSSTPYTKRLYVHQYKITALDELDEQFAGWLAEAYAVGQGAHLAEPPAAAR